MISFNSFPFSDPGRNEEWIKNISRVSADGRPWRPSKHSRVCSDHFTPEDFEVHTNIRRLKSTAVPTIFPTYPANKQPAPVKHRKPPMKRCAPSTSENQGKDDTLHYASSLKAQKLDHNYCF